MHKSDLPQIDEESDSAFSLAGANNLELSLREAVKDRKNW